MANRNKAKGNGAERELAAFLSDVFDESFTRVPNSGAFVGGKNAFRKQTLSATQTLIYKGDLIPPDSMPRLVLESKFYKQFPFLALAQGKPIALLDGWIKQAQDCIDPDDLWLVCFKINGCGWFVVVPKAFRKALKLGPTYSAYKGTHGAFYVTDLQQFFKRNKKAVVRLSAPKEKPIKRSNSK